MVALTVTFKEIFDIIRVNVKKWPVFFKSLRWDDDRLKMEFPHDEEAVFPIGLDAVVQFHGQNFTVDVGSGTIRSIATLRIKPDEIQAVVENNVKKYPEMLCPMAYDKNTQLFTLTMDPASKPAVEPKKRAFQKKFKLLAKLVSQPDNNIRVRIASE